jgi:hypothetical protein
MATILEDTFTGPDGTVLTDHVGETGAAWSAHPGISGSGMVITNANRLRSGGGENLYLASGAPSGPDYDVEFWMKNNTSIGNHIGIGVCFTSPEVGGYLVHNLGNTWNFSIMDVWSKVPQGSYVSAFPAGADIRGKIEVRGTSKKLYLHDGTDYVERIAFTDATYPATGRIAVWSFGADNNAVGVHIDRIMATDSGDEEPPPEPDPVDNYAISGPSAGLVGAQSGLFTVTLGAGLVSGPIRFTPTASAGTGTFAPTFIDLTNSVRSGTFRYTATSPGARAITAPDNAGLADPVGITYTASEPPPLPPPGSVTLAEAIVNLLTPADPDIIVRAGGGVMDYPFISITMFDPNTIANPRGDSYVVEIPFQTTVAALDAIQAEDIGSEAWLKLQEPTDGGEPPLSWDRGLPGREMARDAGPDGQSVFYYHFDTILTVQRSRRRPGTI